MQIGEAIKTLRKKKHLKQNELSEVCGISQTYLSQIENNKRQPTIDVLQIIGNQLGVPVPVILFLALSEQDVSDQKRELFKILNPSIEKFITEIFLSNNHDTQT